MLNSIQGKPSLQYIKHNAWLQLLLMFMLAYGINLCFARDLWVQDEMRYGEVVREMLATGNYLVPHLNGFAYPDKPALYFWLVIAVGKVVGQGEFAFHLVSMLSTLLAGLGVYQLGNYLLGKHNGFWAALIFGSTMLTLIVGQIIRMDMLLTAATIFAWFSLLRFFVAHQHRDLLLFWLCCILSLAIKGPIALLFNLLPGFIWLASARGKEGLLSLRPFSGLLAMLSLVAVWVIAVFQSGQGAYLSTIWHQQLVGRAVNSWSHQEPIYFYWALLPFLLLPWTSFVVKGCQDIFYAKNAQLNSILVFNLVPIIGISLISGKLFIYLMPVIPSMAIAATFALKNMLNRHQKITAWYSWLLPLYLLLLCTLTFWVSRNYLIDGARDGQWIAFAFMLLALVSIYATRLTIKNWVYSTAAILIMVSCLLFAGMSSLLNPLFSARALAQAIERHAPNQRVIGVVNATRGIFNYYAGRTFTEVALKEAVTWYTKNPNALIIIQAKDLRSKFAQTTIPSSCRVNEIYQIELKEYHVLADCKY